VLLPALTRITGAQPSFSDAYPLLWIVLNVSIFLLVALSLTTISSSIIRRQSRVIELDGRLDLEMNIDGLQSYYVQNSKLIHLHLDTEEFNGFIRIQKPSGVLIFEFDRKRIYRYSAFLQGFRSFELELVKQKYVEEEIQALIRNQVIIKSKIRR